MKTILSFIFLSIAISQQNKSDVYTIFNKVQIENEKQTEHFFIFLNKYSELSKIEKRNFNKINYNNLFKLLVSLKENKKRPISKSVDIYLGIHDAYSNNAELTQKLAFEFCLFTEKNINKSLKYYNTLDPLTLEKVVSELSFKEFFINELLKYMSENNLNYNKLIKAIKPYKI